MAGIKTVFFPKMGSLKMVEDEPCNREQVNLKSNFYNSEKWQADLDDEGHHHYDDRHNNDR